MHTPCDPNTSSSAPSTTSNSASPILPSIINNCTVDSPVQVDKNDETQKSNDDQSTNKKKNAHYSLRSNVSQKNNKRKFSDTTSANSENSENTEDPDSPCSKKRDLGNHVISVIKNNDNQNSSTNGDGSSIHHFAFKPDDRTWNCPVSTCLQTFNSKPDLKEHFKSSHPNSMALLLQAYPIMARGWSTKLNKQWNCPIESCPCGYGRMCDLKSHFIERHADRLEEFPELAPRSIFTCSKCGQKFSRRQSWVKHVQNHNSNQIDSDSREFHSDSEEYSDEKESASCETSTAISPTNARALTPSITTPITSTSTIESETKFSQIPWTKIPKYFSESPEKKFVEIVGNSCTLRNSGSVSSAFKRTTRAAQETKILQEFPNYHYEKFSHKSPHQEQKLQVPNQRYSCIYKNNFDDDDIPIISVSTGIAFDKNQTTKSPNSQKFSPHNNSQQSFHLFKTNSFSIGTPKMESSEDLFFHSYHQQPSIKQQQLQNPYLSSSVLPQFSSVSPSLLSPSSHYSENSQQLRHSLPLLVQSSTTQNSPLSQSQPSRVNSHDPSHVQSSGTYSLKRRILSDDVDFSTYNSNCRIPVEFTEKHNNNHTPEYNSTLCTKHEGNCRTDRSKINFLLN